MKNTLEESFHQKSLKSKTLISVKPGNYMMLNCNSFKRVRCESQGLLVGRRVTGDNHKIVLVDEDLILVPAEVETY